MITSIQAQFALSLTEVAQSQLRAQYYQQRISTGAWRERIGKVYVGGLEVLARR